MGEYKTNIASKINLPSFYGKITERQPENTSRPVLAFAGIGNPKKFYQSLEDCGVVVAKTKDFPDHHFYTRGELLDLIDEATRLEAELVTTSKDMVKIPYDLQPYFKVLEIDVEWQDEAALKQFLLT